MRRLHCSVAVVDDVEELELELDEVEAVEEVEVAPEEELVLAPGVVVVVVSPSVVDVLVEGAVVDTAPSVVVVSEGGTATGVSPT